MYFYTVSNFRYSNNTIHLKLSQIHFLWDIFHFLIIVSTLLILEFLSFHIATKLYNTRNFWKHNNVHLLNFGNIIMFILLKFSKHNYLQLLKFWNIIRFIWPFLNFAHSNFPIPFYYWCKSMFICYIWTLPLKKTGKGSLILFSMSVLPSCLVAAIDCSICILIL